MRFLDDKILNSCFEWAQTQLRSTLIERDQNVRFSIEDWMSAQNLGLSEVLFYAWTEKEKIQKLSSMFYGLAKGSMDLPFCSSLAAHSIISLDLMIHFMTDAQAEKYLPLMRKQKTISSVCNSEEGAGSNLKKIKALTEVSLAGEATVNILKPCATNASHADFFLTSTWVKKPNSPEFLAMIILEKSEVKTWSLQHELAGFRTGMTGGIEAQDLKINLKDRLLNFKKTNEFGEFTIFKRCFDMERLFLGVMVAGILDGIEAEMKRAIAKKEASGFKLSDKQYLQEKLIDVYSIRTQILNLVETILNRESVNECSQELALLKILVNEQSVIAVSKLYEMLGSRGYLKNELCQKLIRDFMGLKYFGGTTELQKNNLYFELMKAVEIESVSAKKTFKAGA